MLFSARNPHMRISSVILSFRKSSGFYKKSVLSGVYLKKMRFFLPQTAQSGHFLLVPQPKRRFFSIRSFDRFHGFSNHFQRRCGVNPGRFRRTVPEDARHEFKFYPIPVKMSCTRPAKHMWIDFLWDRRAYFPCHIRIFLNQSFHIARGHPVHIPLYLGVKQVV